MSTRPHTHDRRNGSRGIPPWRGRRWQSAARRHRSREAGDRLPAIGNPFNLARPVSDTLGDLTPEIQNQLEFRADAEPAWWARASATERD